jgi:hypothetical protein
MLNDRFSVRAQVDDLTGHVEHTYFEVAEVAPVYCGNLMVLTTGRSGEMTLIPVAVAFILAPASSKGPLLSFSNASWSCC